MTLDRRRKGIKDVQRAIAAALDAVQARQEQQASATPIDQAIALLAPLALENLDANALSQRYAEVCRLSRQPGGQPGGQSGSQPVALSQPPEGLSGVLRRCAILRQALQAGPAFQAAERQRCASDVVHFVSSWCWTFDPREQVPWLPFDLWPVQEGFLRWMADHEARRKGGLAEKSRDMGVSWLCAAYATHGWLFREGFTCGFGSRKLQYVDDMGNPASILEKVRILLDRLPGFLLPPGYSRKLHAIHGKIVHPQGKATISGEGGDNIGRGGRCSLFILDEAAFLARPHIVDGALSAVTNVRIDVSTPNGPSNPFAQKRRSLPAEDVYSLHWRSDPRKTEDWYAGIKKLFDEKTVAQEFDINYEASIEGICIPARWVRAAVNLKLKDGKLWPQPARSLAGLDVAEEGDNETAMVFRRGPVVYSPQCWTRCDTTQTANRAAEWARKNETDVVYYDAGGVGAGVRGAWNNAEGLPFNPVGVLAGSTPTNTRWPGGKTAKQLFANLKAEMWWGLRARFERAWEYAEQGIAHEPEEMISIPNDPELISQLSAPRYHYTHTGKIEMESKKVMREERGIKSGDRADALCLAFYPERIIPRGSYRLEQI